MRLIPPNLGKAYRKKVQLLAAASSEVEIRQFKSLRLEKLKGDRADQHSIRLNDQWRLILQFRADAEGRTVVVVESADYHWRSTWMRGDVNLAAKRWALPESFSFDGTMSKARVTVATEHSPPPGCCAKPQRRPRSVHVDCRRARWAHHL